MPETVTSIGGAAFAGCSSLTELDIPDQVTTIDVEAFKGCEGLLEVTLGKNIETIGIGAFKGCTALQGLTSNNPEPPVAAKECFDGIDKQTCVLYVPSASIEKYAGADEWRQFVNINGESSSTDDVRAENRSMDICIDGTSLRISGADGQPLGIYGVDGRCEWQTTRYDGEAVELQPGIRVVRVGTAALKVSL